MTKPLFVPGAGAFIPASVSAQIRHPLQRDLAEMKRVDGVVVPLEYVEAVEMIDNIGAVFVAKSAPRRFRLRFRRLRPPVPPLLTSK